ncbi:MAG: phosphate ABC transporter ATP-binding protein [Pikeienuella sp.]|uniref:phosphate ABC transporter ATP-binding protein n=1 Tax=Pikeienuella sp. TaxID=2831957 RepID=UPI00391AFF36
MFDRLETGLTFSETRHDPARPVALSCRNVDFWFGEKQVLFDVSLDIHKGEVTAFVGPSGCGKTTLLKCFNRMHDETRGAEMTGRIMLGGKDVNDPAQEACRLRSRFGWVAQRPNPFAMSIRDNVVWAARIHNLACGRKEEDALAERVLRDVGLWDEVKDRLNASALSLSGGQQQRLCIARALALSPDILLMDEPCSSIDPIGAAKIEEIIRGFGARETVVIITHNMKQAARLAQKIAFFHMGRLVEDRDSVEFFSRPEAPEAKAWLAGRFG